MADPVDRIVELEIKITYQERLLQELDEVVTEQDRAIEGLEKRLSALEARLRAAMADEQD